MNAHILIVDDEPDFLDVLSEFLVDEGYRVTCAGDGTQVLNLLESDKYDLLLSDIQMPGIKGFELLQRAKQVQPEIKTALMTAYEVRDYIRMAKDQGLGNIITKTTPFNFNEISVLIRNILTEDVFGLDKYIQAPIHSASVCSSADIETIMEKVIKDIPHEYHHRSFTLGLGEILVNAVYHGQEGIIEKKGSEEEISLPPGQEIMVSWGSDSEKSGIAVRDYQGRLTKKDVLYWLERNITKGENGLSVGLFDEHGKGLFLTRETIDRLIINVKRNQLAEIVMMNYTKGLYKGFRPLWIHEF